MRGTNEAQSKRSKTRKNSTVQILVVTVVPPNSQPIQFLAPLLIYLGSVDGQRIESPSLALTMCSTIAYVSYATERKLAGLQDSWSRLEVSFNSSRFRSGRRVTHACSGTPSAILGYLDLHSTDFFSLFMGQA